MIEAQEVTESEAEPDVGEDDPAIAVLRVRISPAQARAFAERALKVVAAGRPPCPLCGLPSTPRGTCAPGRTDTSAEMYWIMHVAAGRMSA